MNDKACSVACMAGVHWMSRQTAPHIGTPLLLTLLLPTSLCTTAWAHGVVCQQHLAYCHDAHRLRRPFCLRVTEAQCLPLTLNIGDSCFGCLNGCKAGSTCIADVCGEPLHACLSLFDTCFGASPCLLCIGHPHSIREL